MSKFEQKQIIKTDAIIYLRVSTEEQVDNFSLGTQEEICRKEAIRRGFKVIKIFREEGKSAKNIIGRPILVEMLRYCKKNKNTLGAMLVYRLDRLSRQTSDYLSIRKSLIAHNIKLISTSEPTGTSPTDTLLETIMASFAQHDNDVRSERTKNGMHARFMSGLITRKPPLGYKMNENKIPIEDPETWDKMKQAWDLIAVGNKPLRQMTKIMNKMELYTIHRGKKIKLKISTVQRIFRNKFYAGILTSPTYKEEVQGQHRPMVSLEQFYKVQNILDGRCVNKKALNVKKFRTDKAFPLRRVVKCANCGIGLTAGWSKGRSKHYPYYRCAGGCKTTSIPAKKLDDTVVELLQKITPKKECLELFTQYVIEEYEQRLKTLKSARNKADDEIQRLIDMRKVLVEKNMMGIYTDEIFLEQNALIEKKMTIAQTAKSDTMLEKYDIHKLADFIKATLGDLGATYKRSTVPQVKALIGSIFPSGLSYNYDGTLNHKINPMYQAIFNFDAGRVAYGDPMGNRTPVVGMKTRCPNH
jgi:site-specific DNA recombinase